MTRADILPDLLDTELALVFCGTAPSRVSASAGAYYANPGNQFWRALHWSGITPRQLEPSQFRDLKRWRIGLTDVAKSVAGVDSQLKPGDFDSAALRDKIERYQPAILAFTSKAAFRAGADVPSSEAVGYGWQQGKLCGARVFVLPSPSGAARRYWDLAPWQRLASAYQAETRRRGRLDASLHE